MEVLGRGTRSLLTGLVVEGCREMEEDWIFE